MVKEAVLLMIRDKSIMTKVSVHENRLSDSPRDDHDRSRNQDQADQDDGRGVYDRSTSFILKGYVMGPMFADSSRILC